MMRELPKTYDPKAVEKKIYDMWMKGGYFKGQIDKDKLFYLMSRGFNETGAQLIIVESNIRPVIDALGDKDLENKALQAVREKMQFCRKKGDCHAKCTQRFPHLD